MIPKTIHLVWFGGNEKNKLIQECIASWKQVMPEWTIKEWTEKNYDLSHSPLWVQEAYKKKKWAFVSDYVRIDVLHKEGGVYLDTDMYMIKNLAPLCSASFFIGKEDDVYLSAGVIGSVPYHPFMHAVLNYYSTHTSLIPIPKVLTIVFNQDNCKDILILEKNYFYPFSQETISQFTKTNAPTHSYGVHMWNYSWGPWYARMLHSTKIYRRIKNILDFLGIKSTVKKIMRLP